MGLGLPWCWDNRRGHCLGLFEIICGGMCNFCAYWFYPIYFEINTSAHLTKRLQSQQPHISLCSVQDIEKMLGFYTQTNFYFVRYYIPSGVEIKSNSITLYLLLCFVSKCMYNKKII